MKKTFIAFVFSLIFTLPVVAQPKCFNINDDLSLPATLKSATIGNDFDVQVKKSRPFVLNPMLQDHRNVVLGDTLLLALFAEKEYFSVIKSKTTDVNGTTVLVAKLIDFELASCFISISDQAVLISVDIPERNEKYTTRLIPSVKTLYLLQLDENKLDVLNDGHVNIEATDNKKNNYSLTGRADFPQRNMANVIDFKSTQPRHTVDDSVQIDILMVYTTTAKEWANTFSGSINNCIGQAIAQCNLVSSNSRLGIKFNLVHSTEIDYSESEDSYINIHNLTQGLIPNLYAIRDITNADLVVMITKTDDFGGFATLLTDKDGMEENCYSIVRVQQMSEFNTIHEIGHNLGANHPKDQYSHPGPTNFINWTENTWSAGWRWKGDDNNYYCDVMSYEAGYFFPDGITHINVPYFSDPDILFQGQPTGHTTEANNARTIRETKHAVAAYRDAKTQDTPTVYTLVANNITKTGAFSGGVVTREGASPVTARGIVWSTKPRPTLSDNFTVDTSINGYFKSQLANLLVDSIYYIRAYATNNSGTSYGNQVSFIYTAGEYRDFITRWELPEGQSDLHLILHRIGEVRYTWETVPAEQSGSGVFGLEGKLVNISGLPAGKTIRLKLSSENLTGFCNSYLICPYAPILNPDRGNLVDVEQWGTVRWESMYQAFFECSKLNISATDMPDLGNVTDMSRMFIDCKLLAKVNNMNKWDVSTVRNMAYMFCGADLFDQNIGDWDVSSVKDMSYMFVGAISFNQDIGRWDVSRVNDMMLMFCDAHKFNQNIGAWNVSKVLNMYEMFGGASDFNQYIGDWDVSNVRSMSMMFERATNFNQDIGNWDVSNVIYFDAMFYRAKAFNQNIGNWDVSKATIMNSMFDGANAFNQDVGNWNVSSVKEMAAMFEDAWNFNHDIGKWNVSNVTDMGSVFCRAHQFNQDISKWDVSKVINMESIFFSAGTFNQNISDWDVSSVKSMKRMFCKAISFNQDIGKWNLSVGNNMEMMLESCGMDCKNYSSTLIGWNSNPNTPDSLKLGARGLFFNKDGNAAQDNLKNSKGWSIDGGAKSIGNPGAITGETTLCQNQKSVIYSVPKIENATSYLWTLPNGATGSSTSNRISVDFDANADSGNITVRGVNSCGESEISVLPITVNKIPPKPTISVEGNVLTSDAPEGNRWFFQNDSLPNAYGTKHTATANGLYYVVVDLLGCRSNPSKTIDVTITGTNSFARSNDIKIYPNPFTNELFIESKENIGFEILNSIGQTIFRGNFTNKATLSTVNFAPGTYLIKMEEGGTFELTKMIKK